VSFLLNTFIGGRGQVEVIELRRDPRRPDRWE
jgi:hypothetical protein